MQSLNQVLNNVNSITLYVNYETKEYIGKVQPEDNRAFECSDITLPGLFSQMRELLTTNNQNG